MSLRTFDASQAHAGESMSEPKPIHLSRHAAEQMMLRGASTGEVTEAIRTGVRVPAKRGRLGFRKDFPYVGTWAGTAYETKQVLAIVVDEPDALVVVTVYTFYF
jgi:hypothetical protein